MKAIVIRLLLLLMLFGSSAVQAMEGLKETPDLLEKVDEVGFVANEFRRDSVKLLLGDKEITKGKILEHVATVLKKIEGER